MRPGSRTLVDRICLSSLPLLDELILLPSKPAVIHIFLKKISPEDEEG